MSSWHTIDLSQTIREYDYTPRTIKKMNHVIDSAEFKFMDVDAIFRYLAEEMDIILFPDYLKRYIYEKTEIDIPFSDVPVPVYHEIIASAFEDNKAPFSFGKSKVRKNTVIRNWLTQNGITRSSIFILGFGLKMPPDDVNTFLTKVAKEEGFNFMDPSESIYWYCFQNELPYSQARRMLKWYQEAEPESIPEKAWKSMCETPDYFLNSTENLQKHLKMLKSGHFSETKQAAAYEEFEKLYDRCCRIIADMHNQDVEFIDGGIALTADKITPSHLEKELCSGIPLNKKGNLEAMTKSCFSSLFQNKRMSRQRITTIRSRNHQIERFDLITLLFFVYAQTVETDDPAERVRRYIDEINDTLKRCHMSGIYPVNPYEAFILMCLITDMPMDTYAEIWERSYM